MEERENVRAEFDSVFTKKVAKSRKSYLIWIPRDEVDFLDINENTFLRVGLKKLKKRKEKKK